MKVSFSLLKSFLSFDLSPREIAHTLTLLGVEVDAIEGETLFFEGVIVAKIEAVRPHPNAAKLQIATVQTGQGSLEIVCGAPNCKAGMKTPLAPVGATLFSAQKDPTLIEEAVVRGVSSPGMLCSAQELSLWEDDGGILELPEEWEVGKELKELLWDPVFELSLTPNLGHCLSALGIARELSAALKIPLKDPLLSSLHKYPPSSIEVKIEDPQKNPIYIGKRIENVHIGPSPFWLQKELRLHGMKPICNVVDITNYILLKRGQPLHAFDADRLQGKTISVAKADKKTPFHGLDDIEREIPEGTLLIWDEKGPVAIAGILGGKQSAVHSDTKTIFLEAALFDPVATRKSAKALGLRTESSLRFEKGVDPHGVQRALDEAAHWIETLAQGKITEEAVTPSPLHLPAKIVVRLEQIHRILGLTLSQSEVEEIFARLQISFTTPKEGQLLAQVPSYRNDLKEEIDLIEEVARIYGYNNIAKKRSKSVPSSIPHDPLYRLEQDFRNAAIRERLQEFLNADLISPKLASCMVEMESKEISFLKALRAKTEEYSILRPSLLPGLIQSAKTNFDQKEFSIAAFEVGRIHFLEKQIPVEMSMGALLLSGPKRPPHWSSKEESIDFYDLKGHIEAILEMLHIPLWRFEKGDHFSMHPTRQANLFIGQQLIGSIGQVHPRILQLVGVKKDLFFGEINLSLLAAHRMGPKEMKPLSQFPSSTRDWTLPLLERQSYQEILDQIETYRPPSLEQIQLIDLFQKPGESNKQITFRFTYRDPSQTLQSGEVEAIHTRLIEQVLSFVEKPLHNDPHLA